MEYISKLESVLFPKKALSQVSTSHSIFSRKSEAPLSC